VGALQVRRVKEELEAAGGGYRIVHQSSNLELGVYVLVAPEPDRQQPHDRDEVYVVLEGRGALEVGAEVTTLREGQGAFVAAGADHRFTGYEGLSVLVIFAGASGAAPGRAAERSG
jgi:mannose-6-phosphate isomerase-like protein (cupin superfamily)